jgi:hypothetical protein
MKLFWGIGWLILFLGGGVALSYFGSYFEGYSLCKEVVYAYMVGFLICFLYEDIRRYYSSESLIKTQEIEE